MDFGLVKNTMFNWKHRGNIPSGEVLLKLSEYLDVSVDYLLCNDGYCINDEERDLIKAYRKLNPQQRENIIHAFNSENSR